MAEPTVWAMDRFLIKRKQSPKQSLGGRESNVEVNEQPNKRSKTNGEEAESEQHDETDIQTLPNDDVPTYALSAEEAEKEPSSVKSKSPADFSNKASSKKSNSGPVGEWCDIVTHDMLLSDGSR